MPPWPKLLDPEGFAGRLRIQIVLAGDRAGLCLFVGDVPAGAGSRRGGLFVYLETQAGRGADFVVLLSVFTVLILQAVLRGLNIDCGCFGNSDVSAALATKVGWTKILENLGWLAAAIFVYLRSLSA
jgi:hypothetical protein